MQELKEHPEWLKATVSGGLVGVDRNAETINGIIIAQEGNFKSAGRGSFDRKGLRQIVKLMKAAPNGLKSRFAHPTLSDDGLGKLLGRMKNPRLDTITERESFGELKTDEVTVVRADLHLSKTAHETPSGDLAGYVMNLAEDDPDAFSTSLVITPDEQQQLDKNGRPLYDDDGNELPPVWWPLKLHASDVVDTGDAVDGALSADGLPDEVVRRGTELLNKQFAGQSREVVETRCLAWLGRYLDLRFGSSDESNSAESIADAAADLRQADLEKLQSRVAALLEDYASEEAGEETPKPQDDLADLRARRLKIRRLKHIAKGWQT